MSAMRKIVARNNAQHWASSFLDELEGHVKVNGRGHRGAREAWPGRPSLLVACDYDGTLAPIVENPTRRTPIASRSPRSGRWRTSPTPTSRSCPGGRCATSPPCQPPPGRDPPGRQPRLGVRRRVPAEPSTSAPIELRQIITQALDGHRRGRPGFRIEKKPASVAFHYRNVDPERSRRSRSPTSSAGPASPRGRARSSGARRSSSSPSSRPTRAPPSTGSGARSRPTPCSSSATTSPTRTPSRRSTGPDLGIKVGAGDTAAHAPPRRHRGCRPGAGRCCASCVGRGSRATTPRHRASTRCCPISAPWRW